MSRIDRPCSPPPSRSPGMPAPAPEIRALTASAFTAPVKFRDFCRNAGKPLGGIIDGEPSAGSMNATFQTIDPGSQEVLATVSEMGEAEVARAVDVAGRAFQQGWKDTDVEKRIALVMRFVELCERDRDVLLACEILDGGKVSELAEGDFTQIRACAEYFCGVARRIAMGDGPAMRVADGVKGFTYREPWG